MPDKVVEMKYIGILILLLSAYASYGQDADFVTPFELSKGVKTATWRQAVHFYKKLDSTYAAVKMVKIGKADGGYPLHVVYYSNGGDFNVQHWRREGKVVILVNNAIHPGEPDGVDACMMLLRDIAIGKEKIPDNVVLAVIPVYNIGGAQNRSSTSRANQNGPDAYGFRGNGQNLDLNRDFIKCDAAETRSLERLFTELDPDLFIDNHVSDGADYQHVMTLLATQHDKLGGRTGALMYETLTPLLYKDMKKKGYDMVPYVNDFSSTPVNGWTEFYEPPRFSSGYAALFQTLAYVPETHMLKRYKDRVEATYALMQCMIKEASANAREIAAVRAADRAALINQSNFTLEWKADTTQWDMITFMGYEPGYKKSEVSGLPRLYYDHDKPFTKKVPLFDHFVPVKSVKAPVAYIVPRAWSAVISRLRRSGVEIEQFMRDTVVTVTSYHIDNYETVPKPYEKHYLHKNVQVSKTVVAMKCAKGDYLIRTAQPAKRYLVETLEPTGPDAFFAWNFFDGILQQKEYFSDYVFEDMAADILKKDAALENMLEEKRKQDTAFAHNADAQLEFVYRHSVYMEPGYLRYPVYRLEN